VIAAIYARKSTEQTGVADDAKSVTRQVEHAKAYATQRGWIVDEAAVFVDDAISGAEFQNRPGYMRLLNSLKPRAPFNVLIVSELSRLGREQLETGYACKQLSQAGVRIFSYLENREIALDDAKDVFLLAAMNFAAEIEREKASQRVRDAMTRKARAGYVCGGEPFGYRNRPVFRADGRRSYVERDPYEPEAAVVRRIFDRCAAGKGMKAIAKLLNEEGVLSPRPKLNRPRAWAPSSVRAVLHNEVYRGVNVWNKRKQSDRWGQRACRLRAPEDWIRADVPHWRVVTDEQWEAAHRRLRDAAATYVRETNGQLWGRPPSGVQSRYLLSGMLRCAYCGASLTVHNTSHRRQSYYICASYHERGRTVCENGLRLPMLAADDAVLTEIESVVLDPSIVAGAIEDAIAELRPTRGSIEAKREALLTDLRRFEEQQGRYIAAIGRAGDVPALADALKTCEHDRQRTLRELAALDGLERLSGFDVKRIEQDLVNRLTEWRSLLKRQTPIARQVLARLLDGKIAWTPRPDARRYEFSGKAKFDRILTGIVDAGFDAEGRKSPYRYQKNQVGVVAVISRLTSGARSGIRFRSLSSSSQIPPHASSPSNSGSIIRKAPLPLTRV